MAELAAETGDAPGLAQIGCWLMGRAADEELVARLETVAPSAERLNAAILPAVATRLISRSPEWRRPPPERRCTTARRDSARSQLDFAFPRFADNTLLPVEPRLRLQRARIVAVTY